MKKAPMLDPLSPLDWPDLALGWGEVVRFCPRGRLSLPVMVPAGVRTWLGRPVQVQAGLVRTRGERGAALRGRGGPVRVPGPPGGAGQGPGKGRARQGEKTVG